MQMYERFHAQASVVLDVKPLPFQAMHCELAHCPDAPKTDLLVSKLQNAAALPWSAQIGKPLINIELQVVAVAVFDVEAQVTVAPPSTWVEKN